jgi:flagellar motility protein MotE (MotC chaperone)
MSDDAVRRVERACRDLAAERTPITFDAAAARSRPHLPLPPTATCSNASTPPKPATRQTRDRPPVTRASLQADLLAAHNDIDQLQQRIVSLEQQIVELRLQLEQRDQDLAAARTANRELMAQLNVSQPTG